MTANPSHTAESASRARHVDAPDDVRSSFEVSVLLERRLVSRGRWSQPQWEALAVVVGNRAPDGGTNESSGGSSGGRRAAASTVGRRPNKTVVEDDGERRQCLWTGLEVVLYKDGCEGYWYNLLSERPRLFVVCFDDGEAEGADVEPVIVTPNQDEANAHMESDDPVFSVPMPEQALEWVEQFVVANYSPEMKNKRKRRDWTRESEFGKRPHERSGPA